MMDEDDAHAFLHLYQRSRSNADRRLRLQRLRAERMSPMPYGENQATGYQGWHGMGENNPMSHDPLCPQLSAPVAINICQCELIARVRQDK